METDEFGTVLFCFSISLSEAGFQEIRFRVRFTMQASHV